MFPVAVGIFLGIETLNDVVSLLLSGPVGLGRMIQRPAVVGQFPEELSTVVIQFSF